MPLLAVLLAVALGVFRARSLRARRPSVTVETAHRHDRWILPMSSALLVLLAVPVGAQLSDRVCQVLPLWLQRHASGVTWSALVVLLGYVSSYTSALALLTRHRKRRRLVLCSTLLITSVSLTAAALEVRVADRLADSVSENGVVLQSSGSSCAAAAIANVARSYGIPVTEPEAADLMGTTVLGTSPGQMRYALATYGIEHETLNERFSRLEDVRSPAILFVDHPAVGHEGHAVTFMGMAGDDYEIWDPLEGRVLLSRDEIASVWHGNGIQCMGPVR